MVKAENLGVEGTVGFHAFQGKTEDLLPHIRKGVPVFFSLVGCGYIRLILNECIRGR